MTVLHAQDDDREFCDEFACPRLFRLSDCSSSACPKVASVHITMLDANGDEHLMAVMRKDPFRKIPEEQ